MTGIDPATWSPPVCANGPHPTTSDRWQNNILHNIGGRWICHGCWTVGGITPAMLDGLQAPTEDRILLSSRWQITTTQTELEHDGWISRCRTCGLDSGPWRTRRRARWSGMQHVKSHHPARLRRRSRWL